MLTLRTATRRHNPSVSGFCGTFPLGFERQRFLFCRNTSHNTVRYITHLHSEPSTRQTETVSSGTFNERPLRWSNQWKQETTHVWGGKKVSVRVKGSRCHAAFATATHGKVHKCWTLKSDSGWEICFLEAELFNHFGDVHSRAVRYSRNVRLSS